MMLQDAQTILAANRRATSRATSDDLPNADDEMGDIRIGDETHYHAAEPAQSGKLSTLTKAAIAAGAIAVGGTPAAWLVSQVFKPTQTQQQPADPPATQQANPNEYEFKLLPP